MARFFNTATVVTLIGSTGCWLLRLARVFPPPVRVFVSSTRTRSLRVPRPKKHKVPFGFAQGRLSTPRIIALR